MHQLIPLNYLYLEHLRNKNTSVKPTVCRRRIYYDGVGKEDLICG
jgi:hypothetical protein